MAGDDDDRQGDGATLQLALQFQAAHAGHADIDDSAVRRRIAVRWPARKRFGRIEGLQREAADGEQRRQAAAHGLIVIDDIECGFRTSTLDIRIDSAG